MEHSNVIKVGTQWQLENLSCWHPDVDCHHADGDAGDGDADGYGDEDADGDGEDGEDKEEEEPVFDLHGPLVKDEHRTCGDDEQDRDKLKNQLWWEKYLILKYQIANSKVQTTNNQSIKYRIWNTKVSNTWLVEERNTIGPSWKEQIPNTNFVWWQRRYGDKLKRNRRENQGEGELSKVK